MVREYHFGDEDRPSWGGDDPRPGARHDEHGARLRAAQLARSIESEERMSGDHGVLNTRSWLTEASGFDPVVTRDRLGRLVVDWSRLSEQGE